MPVRKWIQRAGLLQFVVICLLGIAAIASAGAQIDPATQLAETRTAIQGGARIEQSRQWLKAIEHYEEALKQWPDNEQLQYGLRRSKIHFAVERRYADSSFEEALLHKSRRDALLLFDDVLDQVRAYYVVPISSTSFVAHGTESLYLALANPKFVERNLHGVDSERVEQMRTVLKDQFWNKPVAQQGGARLVVEQVCDRAHQLLGTNDSAIVMEYIFGGCNALDDYSSYLTPDRLEDLHGNIEGEFVGLGIEMKSEAGSGLLLVNVLPESPAAEGGLTRGDFIVDINGTDCRNMTTDEAAKLLRGRTGTRVHLSYLSRGATSRRQGDFVRRAVQVKSIPVAKIVDSTNGIGYIKLIGFQKSSPRELDEALQKLSAEGMRSLIWDLRDNPGGLLNAAAATLDRFISSGVLVSTRGRAADETQTYSAYREGTWNVPLVLLVDGNSASASEIVAGAIRDHKRGTIVGRKTYGKWSVQTIIHIRDKTGLRLTTAKFYSPKGDNLSKIGVEPDFVVELPAEHKTFYRGALDEVDSENDLDLQRGLSVLRGQFTRR
ncbi:MAG: S41 family peptidase [Planctomycetaceae bacterium]